MAKIKNRITDVLATIVEALTPLDSLERQRTIQAALTLLGEFPLVLSEKNDDREKDDSKGVNMLDSIDGISKQAIIWMKKNNISKEQLEEVFHNSGEGVEVIASFIPGKKRPEQNINAYVLKGISTYLLTGEANFSDKSARDLCETLGVYDYSNHTKYLASKGNLFTGSKKGGWTLTAPGLKHGAELIKEITKNTE